jgi:hypothetical protein
MSMHAVEHGVFRGGVALALAAACLPAANAHEFCVESAAAIQGALSVAATNGEDDEIIIKSGEYPINTALGASLTFQSVENHSLSVIGSYDDISVCPPNSPQFNLAGTGTVLSGEFAIRPLQISNSGGAVSIRGVQFVSGLSNGPGGGLNVGAASVELSFDQFLGNEATGVGNGGGVFVAAVAGTVYFSNNLLYGNRGTAAGAARLYSASGTSTVRNNTISANQTSTLAQPGGLRIDGAGSASFDIENNIVWGNDAPGGSDFGVFAANARSTNDIGLITPGSTSAGFTSDLSVDPDFAPCAVTGPICLNFELARSSPLVDTGTDPAQKKGIDLAGKPRYIGLHVDIGAFENDRIFANTFQ